MVVMTQNQMAPPNRDPFGFFPPAYQPLKQRKVLLHHHNNAITHALLRNWMFKYSLQLKNKLSIASITLMEINHLKRAFSSATWPN